MEDQKSVDLQPPQRYLPLERSLLLRNPSLASQWQPNKNGDLSPSQISPGSNRIVLWLCEFNHEWVTQINSRNRGVGCPDCNGRFREHLAEMYPDLVKEWSSKNSNGPSSYAAGSSAKILWNCSKCEFEWTSTINNRVVGNGCPRGAGKIVSAHNSLAALFDLMF